MARLTLYFLGAPRIEYEGQTVEPDTRKAVALLAYLAISGGKHTRDKLAALLWPEYDQTRSRAALRRTLSALKKAVSGYALLIDREALAFDSTADILIDATDFRSRLEACERHGRQSVISCPFCLEHLTEAVALYRDDFMAGFSLRDSVAFDGWQYLEGESLRRELAGALQFLVRCFVARGEYSKAIDYARRLLDMDPLDEPAHRQLMMAYSWSGQRSAALRQYRECVRILEEELGVGPLEETTALYEQIVRGDLIAPEHIEPGLRTGAAVAGGKDEDLAGGPAPLRSGSQAPAILKERPGPVTLPLVGRTAEWERLISAFVNRQERGRLVVVEGEAGIGKTRLAQALVASLV
jgi:DNA-binding SARP family transcriptional activator